jgi:hypothetical protein
VFLRTVNAQYSFLLLLGGAADQAGARGVAVPLFFFTLRENQVVKMGENPFYPVV